MRKIEQLLRLVRESHELPMTGVSRPVLLVDREQLGVTFIGHSSFLLQVDGRKVLVDPVFSKRLILLRRQRRPGVLVEDLPPIDRRPADPCSYGPPGYGVAASGGQGDDEG